MTTNVVSVVAAGGAAIGVYAARFAKRVLGRT